MVAGEVSGHFFFGELGYDDGLYAALMMGEILGLSEKPLSALADEIVCPPITPDIRLRCPYAEQQSWLDRVEAVRLAAGPLMTWPIASLSVVRRETPMTMTMVMMARSRANVPPSFSLIVARISASRLFDAQ